MEDNILRVKSAIVDGKHVIFYGEDGRTHKIAQGDPRLEQLMKDIAPALARGETVPVSMERFCIYGEFTKKTGGKVSFFKALKDKVSSFFRRPDPVAYDEPDDSSVEEDNIAMALDKGLALSPDEPEPKVAPAPVVPHKRYDDVKEELKPIDGTENSDDAIIAVIDGVLIPNVEKITPYIKHALKHNSTKAVANFLQRCTQIIDYRKHSVEDMFKFLEKGDLPLADNGDIIAYKILRTNSDKPPFTYVDCHSRKVFQRVGTEVRIPEQMVDLDRDRDCSRGLHIARRGYIGGFDGDVCVMIKLRPEDVMAVPHRDYNKIRVMGYHIIFELPREVYTVLRSNKPMTDHPTAAKMLTAAISGDHIGMLDRVTIRGEKGTDLLFEDLVNSGEPVDAPVIPEEAAPKAIALDEQEATGAHVDPVALQKEAKAIKAKAKKPKSKPVPEKVQKAAAGTKKEKAINRVGFVKTKAGYEPVAQALTDKPAKAKAVKATKADVARVLYEKWVNSNGVRAIEALQELKDFQKSAKKGWAVLGFTQEEIDLIKS